MLFPFSLLSTDPARAPRSRAVRGTDVPLCHHPTRAAAPLAPCLPPTGERRMVQHGQGLILQWFKHLGPSAEPPRRPLPNARECGDSAAVEGPPSLPAPTCTPKHTPEHTIPPFPELPGDSWGPLSLWAHNSQPFPSSRISHQGRIQRSSACAAPAAPGQPGLSPASLAPASGPARRGDREELEEEEGRRQLGACSTPTHGQQSRSMGGSRRDPGGG